MYSRPQDMVTFEFSKDNDGWRSARHLYYSVIIVGKNHHQITKKGNNGISWWNFETYPIDQMLTHRSVNLFPFVMNQFILG